MGNDLITKEQRMASVISSFSERERQAYKYFVNAKQPELSEPSSQECYSLFLIGRDCEEIRRLKPGLGLGALLHARVRDNWDLQKTQHLEKLEREVPAKVMQTQLESADFLQKMLTVMHRQHSAAIDRFLVSGDKDDLIDTPLEGMTLKQYQHVMELLLKTTGQDQKKVIEFKGGVTVTQKSVPTQEEASNILDVLAEEVVPIKALKRADG